MNETEMSRNSEKLAGGGGEAEIEKEIQDTRTPGRQKDLILGLAVSPAPQTARSTCWKEPERAVTDS